MYSYYTIETSVASDYTDTLKLLVAPGKLYL